MTVVNEIAFNRMSWMWRVIPCVGCTVVAVVFVSIYNVCVVGILLLFVKDT